MQLVAARIRQFRNIIDSGRVNMQRSVTCLVGKNDSGKTAFLKGLYRLNPAHCGDATFSVVDDYPRWRSTQDRKSMDIGKVVPVGAEFILEAEDRAVLEPLMEMEIPPSTFLAASRSYDGELVLRWRTDQRDLVMRAVAKAELQGPDRDAGNAKATLDDLREWAGSAMESAGRREAARVENLMRLEVLAEQYGNLEGEPPPAVQEVLRQRLPKFFYFDDYSMLPGRIDLRGVLERDPGHLSAQDRTCLAFLELGGVGRDEVQSDDFEARIAGLEIAADEISREVFTYWSQEPQLAVNLLSDQSTIAGIEGEPSPSLYLDIRLHDARHRITINLDGHSSGFRWFFSFVTAFSRFVADDEQAIVLLDEPGLNLHPRAQRDMLRFIEDRLASKGQVIFTTHSPFMVQPSALERVRTVEDSVVTEEEHPGTVIRGAPFSADPDTLLPVQAALAYQALEAFLEGEGSTLVVPRTSDYLFLTELSRHLALHGRNSLGDGMRVLPLGDLGRLALVTRLLGPQGGLIVLLDGHAFGEPDVHELLRQGRLSPWGVINLGQICGVEGATVEDLFAAEDYLRLFNGAFARTVESTELPTDGGIVTRLEQHQQQGSFDRELPANHLLRTRPGFLESLNAESTEQFDKFFSMLRLANS